MNNWCIFGFSCIPLNAELNPICHLLALLGGATIVVVSRLRVNLYVVDNALYKNQHYFFTLWEMQVRERAEISNHLGKDNARNRRLAHCERCAVPEHMNIV